MTGKYPLAAPFAACKAYAIEPLFAADFSGSINSLKNAGLKLRSPARCWSGKVVRAVIIVSFVLAPNALLRCSPPQASLADKNFARGVELQQRGEFAEAAKSYEAALSTAPQRVDVLSNLGLVYARLGKYPQAVQCFRKALKINPQQLNVRFNLGVTSMQAQDFSTASTELKQVVSAQPSNYLARHLLGLSLLKLGRIPAGITQLEIVNEAEPRNVDVIYTLTSAYIKSKRLEKAKPLIETVLRYDVSPQAHFIVGSYDMATQNFPLAIKEFTEAKKLNPSLPDMLTQLGNAYILSGDRADAVKSLQEALQKNRLDFKANELLAGIDLDAGQFDEAASLLARALKTRPDDSGVLFQLARIARAKNQPERAADLLNKVIAARPDFTPAHILLAQTYFKLKRPAEGKQEMAVVARLNLQQHAQQAEVNEHYAGNANPTF